MGYPSGALNGSSVARRNDGLRRRRLVDLNGRVPPAGGTVLVPGRDSSDSAHRRLVPVLGRSRPRTQVRPGLGLDLVLGLGAQVRPQPQTRPGPRPDSFGPRSGSLPCRSRPGRRDRLVRKVGGISVGAVSIESWSSSGPSPAGIAQALAGVDPPSSSRTPTGSGPASSPGRGPQSVELASRHRDRRSRRRTRSSAHGHRSVGGSAPRRPRWRPTTPQIGMMATATTIAAASSTSPPAVVRRMRGGRSLRHVLARAPQPGQLRREIGRFGGELLRRLV